MKTCTACQTERPTSDFCGNVRTPDGLNYRCRDCTSAAHRERREQDPDFVRRRNLRTRYGITLEEYADLLAQQGGACALCREAPPEGSLLVVDHDHSCCPTQRTCGKCLRGLLCDLCNRGLGFFRDDPERLSAAINYLKETS